MLYQQLVRSQSIYKCMIVIKAYLTACKLKKNALDYYIRNEKLVIDRQL